MFIRVVSEHLLITLAWCSLVVSNWQNLAKVPKKFTHYIYKSWKAWFCGDISGGREVTWGTHCLWRMAMK